MGVKRRFGKHHNVENNIYNSQKRDSLKLPRTKDDDGKDTILSLMDILVSASNQF